MMRKLIGWFNKEFIATGEIDRKYGRILHNAYNNRSTGDYDDFAEFDEEDVKKSFDENEGLYQNNQSIAGKGLGDVAQFRTGIGRGIGAQGAFMRHPWYVG